jgi:anti-sigma regulatory factor (Ser/Thr protein kinase)
MADEVRVAIACDADLVTARAEARAMAERLGFPRPDPTLIATAISEVARNIVVHAGRGEIVLEAFEDADRYGLVVTATDEARGSATSTPPCATTTAAGAVSVSGCRGRGASWTTSRSPPTPTRARP